MLAVDDLPYVEWSPKSGGTERIYADAWESEDVSADATVTEHTVESGARISDHYLLVPVTIKIVLFISGSPIRGDLDPSNRGVRGPLPLNIPEYPDNRSVLGAIVNPVAAGLSAVGLGRKGETLPKTADVLKFQRAPESRLREVFEKLLQLRNDRILISAGTSLGRFDNLAMKSIRITRAEKDGNSGAIMLDCGQVTFAQSETAEALPLPLEPRGQKKSGANAAASGSPVTGQKKSIGASLADKVFP